MSFYIRLGITWNSLGLFSIHNGTNAKRHKNKSHYTTLNCKNGKKKSLMTGHYKTSNLKKKKWFKDFPQQNHTKSNTTKQNLMYIECYQ